MLLDKKLKKCFYDLVQFPFIFIFTTFSKQETKAILEYARDQGRSAFDVIRASVLRSLPSSYLIEQKNSPNSPIDFVFNLLDETENFNEGNIFDIGPPRVRAGAQDQIPIKSKSIIPNPNNQHSCKYCSSDVPLSAELAEGSCMHSRMIGRLCYHTSSKAMLCEGYSPKHQVKL